MHLCAHFLSCSWYGGVLAGMWPCAYFLVSQTIVLCWSGKINELTIDDNTAMLSRV